MRRFILITLALLGSGVACAHVGSENNTDVRIYADGMRVVIRTSIPFAWNVLGAAAPAAADEAGQAIAKPLLTAAAPGLVTITAGGKQLMPTATDAMFEVHDDVAFILNYPRPTEWPVVVKAMFMDRLTNLDTGTVSVFDHTTSRFSRDLEPLASKVIDSRDPSIGFTLAVIAPPAPALPAPVSPAATPSPVLAVPLILSAAGVVAFLAWRRWRAGVAET